MTIEKLPSGNYRIKQMVAGKTYSVITDHRPTKVEAVQIMADKIRRRPSNTENMTLKDACELYIDSRRRVLSASTIRDYVSLARNIPEHYLTLHLGQITAITVQQFVNEYADGVGNNQKCKGKKRAPKTVKNISRFMISALKFCDVVVKPPTMPQEDASVEEPYIPTEEEVNKIMDFVRDTEFEIPFRLAARGLRKSEILALTLDDLSGNIISINKAMVADENGEMVVKKTKTKASTRKNEISEDLADLIRAKGYIYTGSPKSLYSKLRDAQDALGIKHFGFHKFRHFFASYLYQKGFPVKYIQEDGGWSTDKIMQVVYTHVLNKEDVMHEISKALYFC